MGYYLYEGHALYLLFYIFSSLLVSQFYSSVVRSFGRVCVYVCMCVCACGRVQDTRYVRPSLSHCVRAVPPVCDEDLMQVVLHAVGENTSPFPVSCPIPIRSPFAYPHHLGGTIQSGSPPS
jgi:hypothetical protein